MKNLLFLLITAISGIAAGQVTGLLKDINPGTGTSISSDDIRLGTVYNNGLFFMANDGVSKALWYSGGTSARSCHLLRTTL